MCGIVGVMNLDGDRPIPEELLRSMTEALAHRGPDGEGIEIRGPVGFGHRRLSILDVADGHQPWWNDQSGEGMVYNGEIYNYREIRDRLPGGARSFRTNCDTEVLLRLASSGSLEWLQELNGMFAFAYWDESEQCLLLVRDRMGIKPLYYAIADGRFWFASEAKVLLMDPALGRRVNESAVAEYLVYRRVADPETLLAGVKVVPPGHALRIRPGDRTPEIIRYWQDGAPGVDETIAALPPEEQFRVMLDRAVAYRLISDVPVGTYNSGGVDSTLTTAAVRRQTEGELHTFSVGFEEATHDESSYAQIVADRIGTNHHLLVIGAREYADAFAKTIWYNDEPLHHAHTVQLRLLSGLAREYVTVVLTGEGADETFAGYPRYQIPMIARRLKGVPGLLTRTVGRLCHLAGQRRLVKLLELSHDSRAALMENARFVPRTTLARLGVEVGGFVERDRLYDQVMATPVSHLERALIFDRGTYMLSLLHRLDRTTMANGIEARVPYLDHCFVDWSKTLPLGEKMRLGRENKILLKEVAARDFPREMVYRRKMGFDVPVSEWLRSSTGFGAYLDLLRDNRCLQRGYFTPAKVEALVDEHHRGVADHGDILWELINLEVWHRSFIDDLGPLV